MPARKWLLLGGAALVLLIAFSALVTNSAWDGVDVAVVGKYSTDLGRQPWTPFINVQGDLQLFVFTVAGLIGGFVVGYYWRTVFGADAAVTGNGGDSHAGGNDVPGL